MSQQSDPPINTTPPILPPVTAVPVVWRVVGVILLALSLWLGGQAGYRDVIDLVFFWGALIAGISTSIYGFWYCVSMDEHRVRWRDLRGIHTAEWEQITDYYTLYPERTPGRLVNIIAYELALKDGTKIRIPRGRGWEGGEKLGDFFTHRRSTQGGKDDLGVTARTWNLLPYGARLEDLPIRFTYDRASLRREKRDSLVQLSLRLAPLCALLALLGVGVYLNLRGGDSKPVSALGWLLVGGMITLCLFFVGKCLLQWFHSEKARRDAWRRADRNEFFEAQKDGLVYFTESEGRFAPWEVIVGYDFTLQTDGNYSLEPGPLGGIRTADNRIFPFTNRLHNFAVLQAVLRHYAPEAVEARLDSDEKAALGGVAARWTGKDEGKGDRIYHCRTRNNRNITIVFSLMAVALAWPSLVGSVDYWRRTEHLPSDWFIWFVLLVWGFCTLIACRMTVVYWSNHVIIGDEGISDRSLSSKVFLPWSEVQEVQEEEGEIRVIGANGTTITIVPNRHAYGSEIRDRIQEKLRAFPKRSRVTETDCPTVMVTIPMEETAQVIQKVGR